MQFQDTHLHIRYLGSYTEQKGVTNAIILKKCRNHFSFEISFKIDKKPFISRKMSPSKRSSSFQEQSIYHFDFVHFIFYMFCKYIFNRFSTTVFTLLLLLLFDFSLSFSRTHCIFPRFLHLNYVLHPNAFNHFQRCWFQIDEKSDIETRVMCFSVFHLFFLSFFWLELASFWILLRRK